MEAYELYCTRGEIIDSIKEENMTLRVKGREMIRNCVFASRSIIPQAATRFTQSIYSSLYIRGEFPSRRERVLFYSQHRSNFFFSRTVTCCSSLWRRSRAASLTACTLESGSMFPPTRVPLQRERRWRVWLSSRPGRLVTTRS